MSRMSWWATCFKRVSGDDDHDNAVKNYDDSDYNDDDNLESVHVDDCGGDGDDDAEQRREKADTAA